MNQLEPLEQAGKPVIGCLPLYPPVELLHSMGLEPWVLWGLRDRVSGTRAADRHLQGFVCSVARHLTQFVIADGADGLDGVLFYNACDTLRNLPEILQGALAEAGGRVPPFFRLHLPMVPPAQTDATEYLRCEISALVAALEGEYGAAFSEERFAASVSAYRDVRRLCMQLEQAVATGDVPFAAFCETLTRLHFLTVEEQAALLEKALAPAGTADAAPPAARVIVSGILPPPPTACRWLEEAGLRVVGNDIASCHRSYARTPERWDDVADYYVRFYREHFPCTTLLYTADARPAALLALARERKADAFVFVGEKFCEYEYLELPFVEQRLKEAGVAVLSLEASIEDDMSGEATRTRIQAFAEMLKGAGDEAAD